MALSQVAQQWPTATVYGNYNSKGCSENSGDGLATVVKMWTTPQVHDVTMRGSGQKPCSKAGDACLARDAAQWPTPCADVTGGDNKTETQHNRGVKLTTKAENLPTPRAEHDSGRHRGQEDTLHSAVKAWPTPASRDWKDDRSNITDNARPLNEEACRFIHPDPMTLMDGGESSPLDPILHQPSRKLNPRFVEWLMGIPTGWTASGSAATELCQIQQPEPLSLSTGECTQTAE
jgi:DNA (cytosine-5)-methyltransferase 1